MVGLPASGRVLSEIGFQRAKLGCHDIDVMAPVVFPAKGCEMMRAVKTFESRNFREYVSFGLRQFIVLSPM